MVRSLISNSIAAVRFVNPALFTSRFNCVAVIMVWILRVLSPGVKADHESDSRVTYSLHQSEFGLIVGQIVLPINPGCGPFGVFCAITPPSTVGGCARHMCA